jgi:hypothetical protein
LFTPTFVALTNLGVFMKDHVRDYSPSQEEIEQACLEIRKKWSEDEFFKRANIKKQDYHVPFCDISNSCSEFEAEKNIYRLG